MIYELIKDAIGSGEENAVSCLTLEQLTGLNSRDVKRCIEELRRGGTVICSSNSGYFYPARRYELKSFIVKERRRAKSIKRTLKSSERMLQTWEEN